MIIVYLPELGTKIKQLRTQRNMSQITLAQQLRVSKSVISSYENSVHLPPYDVLIQLAVSVQIIFWERQLINQSMLMG